MTSDAVQRPGAPGIHGLSFRRFRAGGDFTHMASITRASSKILSTLFCLDLEYVF